MNIIGIDAVIFGVEDIESCQRFFGDVGLLQTEKGAKGATFAAEDGSSVILRESSDTALPNPTAPSPNVRETIWGVQDSASLESIGSALSISRNVKLTSDGTLRTHDDDGNGIAFRITRRQQITKSPICDDAAIRALNQRAPVVQEVRPQSIGHIVYHTPHVDGSAPFYVDSLGFRITDSFNAGKGTFLRAAGSRDHHTMFLLSRGQGAGLHHLEFHVNNFTEVMLAGMRLIQGGWKSAFGPGRHTIGSNYYWYFVSPSGGSIEFSCGIDQADDNWQPHGWDHSPTSTSIWHLNYGADCAR